MASTGRSVPAFGDRVQRARERVQRASLLGAKYCVQRLNPALRRPRPFRTAFVAGVQRSGTNMVMDVLERSYATEVYHERDPRAFDRYKLRDEATIAGLIARSRAPVVVVKCLMESQRLGRLLERHAPARAVWVFRHYHDVTNSMLRSFRNQARQVNRIAEDPAQGDWLSEHMSEDTLATVRELAAGGLDDASAAAVQWYFRNMLYFDQRFAADPRVRLVHYDALVAAPREQFEALFGFLELEFDPRALHGVTASSVGRRAPPALQPGVTALCDRLYARLCAALPVRAEQ